MSGTQHPQETIARLREMRAEGASYDEMRVALGLKNRNAVAGLVSRHCKDLPLLRPQTPRLPVPSTTAPSGPTTGTRPAAEPPPPPAPRIRIVRTTTVAEIKSHPVHVFEARGCRWPLWSNDASLADKKVCGAPCREGQTFCEGHRRLAYVPRQARQVA